MYKRQYINNTKIKEPITIKAIGNKETLESALRIKYGIAWEIEKYYNYKVDIKSDDNISTVSYTHLSKRYERSSKCFLPNC